MQTFSRFSTISLNHKWNRTRLLSPESEMYQLSRELDIRNLHENSGKLRFGSKYTASHPRANFDICARTSSKNSCKTIHRKTCYLISWICLQSFQQDCLRKHIVISNLTQTPSADSSIPKTHLPLEVHQCRFQNLRICLCSYKNNTLSYLRVKFVNFLNSRLIFNIFCFWMFVNKHFTYITCTYFKKWNVLWCEIFSKYFHLQAKILTHFQVCISVPLKLIIRATALHQIPKFDLFQKALLSL